MGNRATVIFANKDNTEISPAVYLHWQGGAESVYPFLEELDRRHVRADRDYECARFIAIVSEFFDRDYYSDLSLGVRNSPAKITRPELSKLNPGDNGVYVVYREGAKLKKVRRFLGRGGFKELSREEVAQERKAAWAHDYNTGDESILSTFDGKPHSYDEHKATRKAVPAGEVAA